MSTIEVVVINYKRPANIALIARAYRAQTHGVRLTLVNSPARPEFNVPQMIKNEFDSVVEIQPNWGAYTRYMIVPTLDCDFTFFADDDYAPGSKMIAHFMENARLLDYNFASLGYIGRVVDDIERYEIKDVDRKNIPVPVDFCIRGYFYRTDYLPLLDVARREFGIRLPFREDDIMAQAMIQMKTKRLSYIVGEINDPEKKMNAIELPDQHANSRSADHITSRVLARKAMIEKGWKVLKDANIQR